MRACARHRRLRSLGIGAPVYRIGSSRALPIAKAGLALAAGPERTRPVRRARKKCLPVHANGSGGQSRGAHHAAKTVEVTMLQGGSGGDRYAAHAHHD